MMEAQKKRRGRPARDPMEGERVGLSLRVTPATKRALDAAADANGRSLSQEAETRFEASFRPPPPLLPGGSEQDVVTAVVLLRRYLDGPRALIRYVLDADGTVEERCERWMIVNGAVESWRRQHAPLFEEYAKRYGPGLAEGDEP
jgi:hypothetical protein